MGRCGGGWSGITGGEGEGGPLHSRHPQAVSRWGTLTGGTRWRRRLAGSGRGGVGSGRRGGGGGGGGGGVGGGRRGGGGGGRGGITGGEGEGGPLHSRHPQAVSRWGTLTGGTRWRRWLAWLRRCVMGRIAG